jgi:uncharacterized protein involved in exopolysaccharide biosynthesis
MNETPVSAMDDEIDLLDLLVTVAESWKLLVIAPVLIGIAAFTGASFLKPNVYQSSAILRLAEDQAALLHSAVILDPLAESFGYLSEAEGVRDDAREALKMDLASSVDKRTKLVTITAKSTSAEQAQKLNQQATERLLAELTPKGQDKANILQLIQIREQAISIAENSFEQLVQAFPKGSVGASNAEQAVTSIASLVTLVLDNKKAIQEMEQQLLIKGPEVFFQTPTLAQKPMPRKRAMVAVIAALASGFALLLFVFIRKALINAGANPESAKKIAQIKQSFGISSKTT